MTMQPASTEIVSRTAAIIQELKDLEGPLLPILHGIQEEFGHVPHDALPVIADGLNLSRAEVHGVVTFYHDFRAKPAGRHVLKLCQAEACQSMGLGRRCRQDQTVARHRFPRDHPRRIGDAGAGLLPRALRLFAVGDAGR